jgi:multidrug transporter EmrE-like cation transporter
VTTPIHSILLVVASSFIGSFGAVLLKSGAARLHLDLGSVVTNWRLLAGVFAFLLSSIVFLKGIQDGELTVLYPMVSFGYVWAMVWSRIFFGEPFTRNKMMGLGLIMAGIVILGLSGR